MPFTPEFSEEFGACFLHETMRIVQRSSRDGFSHACAVIPKRTLILVFETAMWVFKNSCVKIFNPSHLSEHIYHVIQDLQIKCTHARWLVWSEN